jgi:DNA-binding NarL/FixJ family response regulator
MNEFANQAYSVLIVDDHPMVREGLSRIINQEDDLEVCGEAADVREARAALQRTQPNVVIVDLCLRASNSLDLIKDIRSNYGQLPILVCSMHDENIYAERSLSAGANGYIMKDATADQLLAALRRVLAGEHYVSEHIKTRMIERLAVGGRKQTWDRAEKLSDRELEILSFLGRGKTTRQVAESLNLSVKTVDSHRQHIKKKLGLQTSAQVTQFAIHRLMFTPSRSPEW